MRDGDVVLTENQAAFPTEESVAAWEMPEYLAELLSDDPESGHELLQMFIADTARQMATLEEALLSADRARTGRILHTLKGSAGQMGAAPLARLCAVGEARLGAGEALDAAELGAIGEQRDMVVRLMQARVAQQ